MVLRSIFFLILGPGLLGLILFLACTQGGFAPAPNLEFVYSTEANIGGVVYAYSVNISTGALTALPGAPFTAGTNGRGIVIDPAFRYLFALSTRRTLSI